MLNIKKYSSSSDGEGKTTTTVGIADSLSLIGKNAMVALREPSIGPIFGIKGGVPGSGRWVQVITEDTNLYFISDFHAIESVTVSTRATRSTSISGRLSGEGEES